MDAFVDLLLLAGRALGPIIRRFISLGLNRVWTKAGDTVYRQGEPAESLYILISGRLRLLRADPDGEGPMVVEEEVRPLLCRICRASASREHGHLSTRIRDRPMPGPCTNCQHEVAHLLVDMLDSMLDSMLAGLPDSML